MSLFTMPFAGLDNPSLFQHLGDWGAHLNYRILPQELVNGIELGAIYALLALGYTMVYGILKLINFAHGEVYMLGAFIALFCSWALGFTGLNPAVATGPLPMVLMLFASMVGCALIGLIIERFAYRPMRSQSRISTLITAIGVSMFLQYGGTIFLPSSPEPSINKGVNPYQGSVEVPIIPRDPVLKAKEVALKNQADADQAAFDAYMKRTGEGEFSLSAPGLPLRTKAQNSGRALKDAQDAVEGTGMVMTVETGQAIMFGMAVLLMAVLTYVVRFTAAGRAMRAVSLDFDSASLMGIDVNKVVVFTFVIGSSLAGAGAMMTATFLGSPLNPALYGVLPGLKAFVAAVLGGIGNIPGAVLGGILMGVAETIVVWAGFSSFKDAIAFVILIVVLLIRPGGLLGSARVEKV
jgi:branched-chain amino acid transport system permease protein